MKRYFSALLMLLICCIMFAGCQQKMEIKNCMSCGTAASAEAKYCSECGAGFSNAEVLMSAEDEKKIFQAISVLCHEWDAVADEDERNDGHLEVKNTRILWVNPDDVETTLGVSGIECIVEFVIFTDYYGAAPYYYETANQNNVVFFEDGTCEVVSNAVNMYRSKTFDAALENCEYSVKDYGSRFNAVYDLK